MILHDFFRSGTSHRLRIALNLKGLEYDRATLSLPRGEHKAPSYLTRNPQGLVPTLEVDGVDLIQTPAILEWLEESFPDPPLLPADPFERQQVRAMAALIGCDIHPINNLRVLHYLRQNFGADEPAVRAWCGTWITAGFTALEAMLDAAGASRFCHRDRPTFGDCYLVPQVFSARRFEVSLDAFPRIVAIDAHCNSLPAFRDALPENQPDGA